MRLRIKEGLFNKAYRPYIKLNTRYQIYFGGASSGKSYFLAQRAVLDLLQGRNYLVVRNVAKTLRTSVWNEMVKAILRMGLKDWFEIHKSDMTISAKNNGAQCLFAGLDDVEKVKSITPASGVLTDIWIEEATEIAYKDFKQLDKRLRGESQHAKRVTMSFNPIVKGHWLYTEFFTLWEDDKNNYSDATLSILKTTYKDNAFLTEDDRQAMESETNEYYRDVYVLGNWGVLGALIFTNWEVRDLSEFEKTHNDKLGFGLDFGFSVDPCAVLKLHHDAARKEIYILDEIYERGLTNTALAERLKTFAGRNYITCDSAEPKSIQELNNLGIRALSARKGPDSVEHGIQWLQGYKIVVEVKCQNFRNEIATYQWQTDKNGNVIRRPMDVNNHCMDALRYGTEDYQRASFGFVKSKEELKHKKIIGLKRI